MLEERTRERVPLDWAATQDRLGLAPLVLGRRESGTERLGEAIARFRVALEERSRERVPLEWASTLNNLGIALVSLGERESGTERLEEAVVTYQGALEERTRERVPLEWAMTRTISASRSFASASARAARPGLRRQLQPIGCP